MRTRAAVALVVVAFPFVASVSGCDRIATNLSGGADPASGLLRGKMPNEARSVTHLGRLTDGIASAPGDPAQTDLTAELAPSGDVTWDLGAEGPLRCALIDADGDATFKVSVSRDGSAFDELWTAGVDEDRGQQLRAGRDLRGRGRYLRLQGTGTHGPTSVSELSVWRDCPKQWPPLAMQKGTPDDEAVRFKLWAFAALAVAYVLAYRKSSPDWLKLLGVAPAGLGIPLVLQLSELWPPSPTLKTQLACVAAGVVGAVVIRLLLIKKTPPPADPSP